MVYALVAVATSAPAGLQQFTNTATASAAAPTLSVPASAADALAPSYTVPSDAVVVSTTGNDANPGTVGAPVATLDRAVALVKTGGTIAVRGGTYRQGVADPGSTGYPAGTKWTQLPASVTIENYPGETVWFDGTDVATGWTQVGSYWAKHWETPTFCANQYYSRPYQTQASNGPCSHPDTIGGNAANGDPQMAFRNGAALTEVTSTSALNSSSFYYDQSSRTMYVGADPTTGTVELTKRAQALAVLRATNLTIRGLGFRRFGTNEYTNATQGALVINGGTGNVLDHVAITQNAGGGLLTWQAQNFTVRSSYISDNGFTGYAGDGSLRLHQSNPAVVDNLLVEYSRFDNNNTARFGVNCTASCASAGAKFAHMIGFTARYNSFSHNAGSRGSGVWCDLACDGGKIYSNVVDGNDNHGIVYEVSDNGLVANNLVMNNGWVTPWASGLMIGSAHTRLYNNTLINNYNAVLLYDDPRNPGSDVGPNTVDSSFVNNLVIGGSTGRSITNVRGAQTTGSQVVASWDQNSYYRPSSAAYLAWQQTASQNQWYTTPTAAFAAWGVDQHAQVLTSAPAFVSPSTLDYRLSSPASVGVGAALPADIAALVGVASGTTTRGLVAPVVATATPNTTPAPTPTIAQDSFDRSVTGGWGSAPVGGAWSLSSTSATVSNGMASLPVAPGRSESAVLPVSATTSDVSATYAVASLPVGGNGVYIRTASRVAAGRGAYAVKVLVFPTGRVLASLIRVDAASAETQLTSWTDTGLTVKAGTPFTVRMSTSGTSPTTIKGKAWAVGTAEPSTWTVSGQDATAALQQPGALSVALYLSGSTQSGPAVVKVDTLVARSN